MMTDNTIHFQKYFLCSLLSLIFSVATAQNDYRHGYVIINSGEKVECKIDKQKWKNNPSTFKYLFGNSITWKEGTPGNIIEFGVKDQFRYISAEVNLEVSSSDRKNLSSEKAPIYQRSRLFLKVINKGEATLYLYKDGGGIRFFYKIDGETIIPLEYKKYRNKENKVSENVTFRFQLAEALESEIFKVSDFMTLDYKKKSLQKLFSKYNSHKNPQRDNIDPVEGGLPSIRPKPNSSVIQFSLRPGLGWNTLKVDNLAQTERSVEFQNEISFRIGLETEFFVPSKDASWSIFLEPTYRNYRSGYYDNNENIQVIYKSLEWPFGIRKYYSFSEQSLIMFDIGYSLNYALESKIQFENQNLEVDPGQNFAIGIGYKHALGLGLNFRYGFPRDILTDYTIWKSEFGTFDFMLSYPIMSFGHND